MVPEHNQLPTDVDLVILGSGAGGLTAALTASLAGLKTVVLEHADCIGGTSARSSGTVWIPDSHYLRALGVNDDREKVTRYLTELTGGQSELWQVFLDQGPNMLQELEQSCGITFSPYLSAPDYRQDCQGAASGGRPLEPKAFDGRKLKQDFLRLAWPLPELMLFGKMMVTRSEAIQLIRVDRSLKSIWLGLRLVTRYLVDRLRYPRGTRLVLGNALIAQLLYALRARQVPVLTGIETKKVLFDQNRVSGLEVQNGGKTICINSKKGVVLAGGGFPANKQWRQKYLPKPVAEYTAAAQSCDGSTIELGLQAGAVLGPSGSDNALWFPSSIATRRDGTTAVYPHIVLDRSKPGLIAVNHQGKRFVNEAVSYHEFVRAMYRANQDSPTIPAYLICSRSFIFRYGLGLIRPKTPWLKSYVDRGYLYQAGSVKELAKKLHIPEENLQATVARYNGLIESGHDDDFNKGDNLYDRSNGDAEVAPNPCLGPIEGSTFYALPVYPTPLGTSRGLVADTEARACGSDGQPINGLYVCGNDMQSAFSGEYPGAGAQLGQAMTFGWIAARHASGMTADKQQNTNVKIENKLTG